jgi:NAD(P)-dependent dehydrogenase (short-subunit alcohol dehydrogenase family)
MVKPAVEAREASLGNATGDEKMTALVNKVAIVTGASSGIGYATAKLFAEEGAKVVVTARRRTELDALVTEIEEAGGAAVAVAGDVRDEALAEVLVETAVGHFGGLDVAFNNAGSTGEMAPVTELSVAGWRDTLDTNLTSAFLGAKYQIPPMISRGGGSLSPRPSSATRSGSQAWPPMRPARRR